MERINLKFFWPLTALLLGTLLADLISQSFAWGTLSLGISLIGVALIVWLVLHLKSKDPVKAYGISKYHVLWIILLFSGIGLLNFYFHSPHPDFAGIKGINGNTYNIKGEILKKRALAEGDKFVLKVIQISDQRGASLPPQGLYLLIKSDGYNGNQGDIIGFSSKLNSILPSSIKNPGYRASLKHQGISLETRVRNEDIKYIGRNQSLENYFNSLREDLEILIEKSSLNRDTGDFMISLLLGDKYFLASENRETFNEAGMAHILALSGMHVAILISLFSFLLLPLSFLKKRKIKFLLLITFIWIYVFLTGSSPSTIRAAIMATLLLLSIYLERKNSALNSLFAAIIIILIFNPYALWDIGLQLSALCVASILCFSEPLNLIERHTHPHLHKIVSLVLTTLICTFATWALIAYHFKNIPLLFLPGNLILVPFLPVFMAVSLLFIFLLILGIDTHLLSGFLDIFYEKFISTASFLSADGKSNINPEITELTVLFWIFGLTLIAASIYLNNKNKKIKFRIAGTTLFIISILTAVLVPKAEKQDTIVFPFSFSSMEVKIYTEDKTIPLKFKRGSVSKSVYGNHFLLAVDCKLKNNFFQNWEKNENLSGKNFLILGSNADFDQIASMKNLHKFHKIILHSSVGKNKMRELLEKIPAECHNNIYFSRENGSFETDL